METVKKIEKRKKSNLSARSPACFLVLMGMALPGSAPASVVQFNEILLKRDDTPVEMSYFESGNGVVPGTYELDLYLNQSLVKRESVRFVDDGGDKIVRPLLTVGLLKHIGIDTGKLEADGLVPPGSPDDAVAGFFGGESGASVDVDIHALSLHLVMPQKYIARQPRGHVDASLWDDGMTALFSDYQASYSRNTGGGYNSDYAYLGLHNGFNVGRWRLRNDASLTRSGNVTRFASNRSYAERDLRAIKGRVSAGELYTSGQIFDSFRFLGAQLASDTGMLPDNENGFAPVVRGIAESHATVEVRQNGYLIYSTPVSPGAFEIADIYPSGSNGDLEVRIIEADGRARTFTQAYSYVPVMVRRGGLRYHFATGKFRNTGKPSPTFAMATLVYGVTDNITGFGGLLVSQRYTALNLGAGFNSPFGGLSLDVTHSQSDAGNRTQRGQSARVLYSKTLAATDTTLTMIGYRYSTEGFRTFAQHADDLGIVQPYGYQRQKSRFDVNVNQSIRRGSLFVSLGETSYWGESGRSRRYQLGYSGNLSAASYSVALSHTRESGAWRRSDTQVTVSTSIPLGSGARSLRAYTNVVSSFDGRANAQSGVSGFVDRDGTLGFSAQAGYEKHGGASGGIGMSWDARMGKLGANYNQSRYGGHFDVNAAGSIVVHRGGVTFGQPVGETFAVVRVSGVKGAQLDSSSSISTDGRGYAVVPYMQPYRYNWLNLAAASLGTDTEVSDSTKVLVPTRGAVVAADFEAEVGRRVQFVLQTKGDAAVPIGAMAYGDAGRTLGVVDNQSRLMVFGAQDRGDFEVRWRDNGCRVRYTLPQADPSLSYDVVDAECIPDPAGAPVAARDTQNADS
ncbi:fimbrial biogenesis outer membrane usher protein [Burkholderia pseudomultivorans]|uniref:fimbria/pilus outer membrane usher protein n=1 Tax=Burkholderia pseudomultivorans TaxID=1207504 RepID=UPI002876E598|nr:fimbria/pilus outer membrane usher protein [Burkholderia pseudomultivorans]MDS0856911.1 fimbrial biogenesis outer membrane usher protein [Burkholderia pseudomultivorans]